MQLETVLHRVNDIRFSEYSRIEDGVLFINRSQIEPLIAEGIGLTRVELVKPGESVRIAPVLDVVEPRAKKPAGYTAFPGFLKPRAETLSARTHILRGVAVVGVANLPGIQEGLIDMQNEARPFCPFSRTLNVVLSFQIPENIDRTAADNAIRISMLQVAEYLAGLAVMLESGQEEYYPWPLPENGLAKAALIYLVQSQGNLRRTFLFGQPMDEKLPSVISPLEILDGALVSGNFVMPCNKTCTYIHQNNPLVHEMLKGHGRSFDFEGVILANEMSRLEDKKQVVQSVIRLTEELGVAGVVINQEGGANTLTDVMMLCRELERQKIKTVLILNEFAGEDGTTPSLAETTPEAEYIVSTGNNDFRTTLQPVDKFIGYGPFPGVESSLKGTVNVPLTRIHSSTNQLGFGFLSCRTDSQPLNWKYSKFERPLRIVHYLNQFFGQIGGEDKADAALQVAEGAIGPGLAFKMEFGETAEIVATIICGDNAIAENLEAKSAAAVQIIKQYQPDLFIAGPCFNAGRYGMACGAVCKAVEKNLGIPTVTGITETNPAVDIYRQYAYMVPVGSSAAKMRQAVKSMVKVSLTLAQGRHPEQGSILPRGIRELATMEKSGAARAVGMLVARLSGEEAHTELPLPKFEKIGPSPPIADLSQATIVLATEGGLTPKGNPDGIEMSMATKFGCYSLKEYERLSSEDFTVAHGGFDNRSANEDPNRLMPLDVMREFERSKIVGRVAEVFYTTAGNATSVENAKRFGREMAEDIRRRFKENVGVIFTST